MQLKTGPTTRVDQSQVEREATAAPAARRAAAMVGSSANVGATVAPASINGSTSSLLVHRRRMVSISPPAQRRARPR